MGLTELFGTERTTARGRTIREPNLTRRVVTDQAGLDRASEGGPGGQDHSFLSADAVAGLRVGTGLGAEREAPRRLRRRAEPLQRCHHRPTTSLGSAIWHSDGDGGVLRGELCHLADTDDPLFALERGRPDLGGRLATGPSLDHRSLLVAIAHGLPSNAAATRDTGRAATTLDWVGEDHETNRGLPADLDSNAVGEEDAPSAV